MSIDEQAYHCNFEKFSSISLTGIDVFPGSVYITIHCQDIDLIDGEKDEEV